MTSIQFENTFLQQIIDKIKSHEKMFNLFVDILFKKVFLGRNVNIKVNDLKLLIKFSMNVFGPFYFMHKLIPFLASKDKGGARTSHQINGIYSLLSYIMDSAQNKLKDAQNEEFKVTFFTLENSKLKSIQKKLLDSLTDNLKSEEKICEERETSSNSSVSPMKNSHFFLGFINFFDKYANFCKHSALNFSEHEELNKIYKNISNILEKTVAQYELKNVQKKVIEIRDKFC